MRRFRVIWIALVFWALAGTTYAVRRATFGDRPAAIHVRWARTVTDAERQQLEHQYGLTAPARTEGRTFAYALTNLSRANITGLVGDPAIEDTHEINRTAYRIGFFAPRLPYPTPYPSIPSALDLLALVFFGLGVGWTALRGGFPRVVQWLGSRIPDASPESAALFRIVFGACLLIVVLRRPVTAAWAAEPSNVISPAQHALLQLFVQAPGLVDALPWWLAIWGALFVAGAFTRIAFACVAIGVFAWALLYTTTTTYHTVSSLLLALLALQWARWSDAWSVDAWRRGRVALAPPKQYGYTIWVPGLVLGVVYAAAAVAKLRDAGFAWITNGTVKYHFLSDSTQAMVDWGLWIGRHHWLSVLLSFGAIAIEALVIVGVLMRGYRYRALAGAAALCLVSGFALFQGLFWPAWWLLILSFLPWHAIGEARAAESQLVPRAPVYVALSLVALQLVVSVLKLEVSPLISTYDMYATTYGSPAEYEQKAGQAYWIVGVDGEAQVHRCRITRSEADAIAEVAVSQPAATAGVVRRCFDRSLAIREVSLEATRVHIDWMRWERLDEPIRTPLTSAIPLE